MSNISSDGRYIAFDSYATDLVGDDTNGDQDVFLHDTLNGTTTRVSTDSSNVEGNDWSWNPSVTDDGRYVAFQSTADNLVPGDTTMEINIFVHDRDTDEDGLFDEPGAIDSILIMYFSSFSCAFVIDCSSIIT